jgi:hypothetical protein
MGGMRYFLPIWPILKEQSGFFKNLPGRWLSYITLIYPDKPRKNGESSGIEQTNG